MPPKIPIRDMVDRCRIWESHADPAVHRVSKPSPDPIYPAYVVGDSDNISETTWVAAVTRLQSGPDQLEDLLQRLLTAVDTTTPIPEVPVVAKLLQRLVAETQSSAPGRRSSGVGGIGKKTYFSRDNSNRGSHLDSDPSDGTGTEWYVLSCGKLGHAATRCPNLDESFPFMLPGWRAEKTPGGFIMIPPRVAMDRRRTENGD